jgi:CheY-like chemotaxis protein
MKRILIVDDQSEIRKLIRLSLMRRYELIEAESADDALKQIHADRPSAVILDVMMPGGMNGYELCEKIKQDDELRDIHVVLVTARGQATDREQGQTVGADGYFVKPFSPMALMQHLEGALKD